MFQHVPYTCSYLDFSYLDSLFFLDVGDYFTSHVREFFSYYLFKYFLRSFLSLFCFWDPYNENVGVFDVVLEVPKLFSFLLSLVCPTAVIFITVFQLTDPFFCLIYSAIDSFKCICHFSYCVQLWLFLIFSLC